MASFREQMQRLADNIARTRSERKAFLDKNKKECTRKKRELKEQLHQTKTELAREAKALSKQLGEFNKNNQKTVEKTLRDFRSTRIKAARIAKSSLKQEIVRNRRDIVRMLRQSNSERMRAARQLDRTSAATMQSVRSQVQRIRSETKRMTKSWARDRNEARQIWMRLQNVLGSRRENNYLSRAAVQPAPSNIVSTGTDLTSAESSSLSESVVQRANVLPVPPSMTLATVS